MEIMYSEQTEIEILDYLLTCGVDKQGTVLILGDCGSGKSILCKQFVYQGLAKGQSCIYVTTEESSDEISNSMNHFNWDLSKFRDNGQLMFLDFSSAELSDLNQINLRLISSLKKIKHGNKVRVIIDSLTTLCSISRREDMIIDFLRDFDRKIKLNNLLCLFTLNRQGFDDKLIALIKDLSDSVIELKVEEEYNNLRTYLRISKMKNTPHTRRWIPYTIGHSGLNFFIPKVIMTGLPNAGKSSIIHSLKQDGSEKEHNYIITNGMNIEILDPKILTREFIHQVLWKDISGIIVVIDAADPGTFSDASQIINEISSSNIPTIVLANKQDLPDAIMPQNLKEEMCIPDRIPVIGVTTLQTDILSETLRTLYKMIVKL